MTTFDALGLHPNILKAVSERGYVTPTPIQAKAIPAILAGKDIMGGAQTGTGKTAGFTLPMLQRLLAHANTSPSPARHPVRALILTPTRELAIQVEESVRDYGKYTGLRGTVVYGGVGMDTQEAALRAGVELLVATPGRLLDHVQQKTLNLNQVEIFVLDEADRMLDMGFIPDIKRIIGLLPPRRQNLLFSATFSAEIKKLADQLLNQPELIEVAKRNTAAETVTQLAYVCKPDAKRALLEQLLRDRGEEQALVFMRTKQGAGRLARQLEKAGFAATAIHGDKSQLARIEALDAFKDGSIRVLVATDVAARGLDIEELPLVFNFELPYVPEDYIHRIGRTGRAGASGVAISIVGHDEEKLLAEVERLLKRSLLREALPELRGESRPARHPAPAWGGIAPSRDKSHFDRNPDQSPATRGAGKPAALVASGIELPPLPARRGKQVAALLMKRPATVTEAETSADSGSEAAPGSTPAAQGA